MDEFMDYFRSYLEDEDDFGSFGQTTFADWTSGNREMTLRVRMYTVEDWSASMFWDSIDFDPGEIVSYTIDEQNGSAGIDIGSVISASYKLVLDNTQRHLKPEDFKKSFIVAAIGIKIPGQYGIHYEPFGVWDILDVNAPEQSAVIEITGLDVLGTACNGIFNPVLTSDGAIVLQFDWGSLMEWTTGGFGPGRWIMWDIPDSRHALTRFWNDDLDVPPTLYQICSGGDIIDREVLSWMATYIGCFVRVSRGGEIQFRAYDRIYEQGEPLEIDPSTYFTYTPLGVEPFEYNHLRSAYYRTDNITQEGVVERYVDDSIKSSLSNTIQTDTNPFMTTARATILHNLFQSNLTCEPLSLTFMGAPMVEAGDHYYVRDLNGDRHKMIVNSMSTTYDGGLSMTIACDLPSDSTQYLSVYSGSSMRMEFAKRGGLAQYTESEVATGTKWIDGKPLYRRLIVWPASSRSGTYVSIGEQVDYCNIIHAVMHARESNGAIHMMPNCYLAGTYYVSFFVNSGNNRVGLVFGSAYTCLSGAWALIEYTKLSDEPDAPPVDPDDPILILD